MKKIFNFLKSKIAITLSFAILVTTIVPNIARASEEQLDELEELLIYELSEENIEVESVDIYLDEISIEVSVENADGYEAYATLEFAPGDTDITLYVEGYNENGDWEEREFTVDLTNVDDYMGEDDGILEVTIEDVETGEVLEYDSEYGELSGVITATMVSAGIIASLATLAWLLTIGVVVIIAGMVWMRATEATESRRSRDALHFRARIHRGHVVIGRRLTNAQAATRLRNGNDTWSPVRARARTVARNASGGRTPINDPAHYRNGSRNNRYMPHYHPNPRTGAHAFFGFSATRGLR